METIHSLSADSDRGPVTQEGVHVSVVSAPPAPIENTETLSESSLATYTPTPAPRETGVPVF